MDEKIGGKSNLNLIIVYGHVLGYFSKKYSLRDIPPPNIKHNNARGFNLKGLLRPFRYMRVELDPPIFTLVSQRKTKKKL